MYFVEQEIIPKEHVYYLLRMTSLWENYPKDTIAYHQHIVKWNYHFWLEEIEKLESYTGEMMELKYPFRDKKETLLALKDYSIRLLKNPLKDFEQQEAWTFSKDRRCVWQKNGNSIELNQDNLYRRYFVEHIRKPLKPYLWRKNPFGVSMLCNV